VRSKGRVGEVIRAWRRSIVEGLFGLRTYVRWRGFTFGRALPDIDQFFYLNVLFRHYGVDCVLDVGANRGVYARMLRRNGYRGTIIAFEPNSEEFERLMAEAQGDPRWSSHRLALGRRAGTLPLNVTSGSTFASFHTPSQYGNQQYSNGIDVVRQEPVPMERLDVALPRLLPDFRTRRIALKIDTQGHDLEVLAGAAHLLDHIVVLQTELAVQPLYESVPTYLEALRQLHAMGFAPSAFFPGPRDEMGRLIELDCVMVRAEG
jgi:FkbM family methyltransferase